MNRRTVRLAVSYATLALITMVVVSCDDDGASPAPLSTAMTIPVVLPSTTGVELGPDAPLPTVAGQITVASTIAPPLDPEVDKAVKKAIQDFFAAYMKCGQAPGECHAADFHSTRGTAVGQGTVYFQGLAARGEHFADDLRGSYIVTQSVALDDPTSAITFSCWYDASILLGPPDASGQPAVLNDRIISVREKQAVYFDGTDWKVGEAATVQDLGDGNQCPPPDTTV